jgi:NADH dehydrogenase [ubiquinone] 1 alpha subcomplex assembly factor 7
LRFALAPNAVSHELVPASLRDAPLGSVYEFVPAASGLIGNIADRIVQTGGVALIIDYGHQKTAVGDTFQAVKNSTFAHPLAEPGESDLTAHVDFDAMASAARDAGGRVVGPVGQGAFLESLGLRARASRLKIDNPERAAEIGAAVERLSDPKQMGTLFKVLAVYEAGARTPPPGFA